MHDFVRAPLPEFMRVMRCEDDGNGSPPDHLREACRCPQKLARLPRPVGLDRYGDELGTVRVITRRWDLRVRVEVSAIVKRAGRSVSAVGVGVWLAGFVRHRRSPPKIR